MVPMTMNVGEIKKKQIDFKSDFIRLGDQALSRSNQIKSNKIKI